MSAPTLTACVGLPGSGKSTWALDQVRTRGTAEVGIVGRDPIRASVFGAHPLEGPGVLGRAEEEMVTSMERHAAAALLRSGRDVIVDDLNLRARYVREWYAFAAEHNATFRVEDFTTVPLETCLYRAQGRSRVGGRKVPDEVIVDLWQRYVGTNGWTMPEMVLPGPAPALALPYDRASGDGRLAAWLFDMDGTLALMRTGDGARTPFQWHRVGEDDPHHAVIELAKALSGWGHQIIVMSGRDEVCRPHTEEWLRKHGVWFDALFMRPAGDQRKDSVVKAELFDRHVRGRYDVQGVVDDRDQVVALWRGMGLTCLQANYGAF